MNQIKLELDLSTDTTGNAQQVAEFVGAESWRIQGDYLVVVNPLLSWRIHGQHSGIAFQYNVETKITPEEFIPNGATVSLIEREIENEIQNKALNAPSVTHEQINNLIVSEHYFTAGQAIRSINIVQSGTFESSDKPEPPQSLNLLTFCVLTLKNGFTVSGESACASPLKFNAEIGREIARDNAIEKIWMLEGYLLKEKLYQAELDK